MSSRRKFLQQIAAAAGGTGLANTLLASIQKAAAIDPVRGSTYLDAEHVVILMQENRSFDHALGKLRGVRGFGDPRTVVLPDGNPVWAQTNAAGETYAPFHLDIKNTRITWLSGLPHRWTDQQDARAEGNHDKWLDAKPSGFPGCEGKPYTMGYYSRTDIPFYYALADTFTVCDQNFCSSLTGTSPNRLHLWTGTIRENSDPSHYANVRNPDIGLDRRAQWMTFPERLEDAGIPWRIYQNELSIPTGLTHTENDWLGNFSCNSMERFSQYNVEFHPAFVSYLEQVAESLPKDIQELEEKLPKEKTGSRNHQQYVRELRQKKALLEFSAKRSSLTAEEFAKLSVRDQNLHRKAFTTNTGDPMHRKLAKLKYQDGSVEREMDVPAGDVFHQFRKDVNEGKLPTVSWLVAPSWFSDHPGSPWFGAWYVSEVMNILTKNPDVWRKTIFVLTYDENDGYFDHVPPFVPPNPYRAESGKVSAGIDTKIEYHTLESDQTRYDAEARGGPIGLGFRVPMLIASPWSRGGNVCSQVFDHTSVLQLLENLVSHKTGKQVLETNISKWRRTVCGDLSSAFHKSSNAVESRLPYPPRNAVLEGIHKAQFKQMPSGFRRVQDIQNKQSWMTQQETGLRPALPLPYVLHATGSVVRKSFELTLESKGTAGAPFYVYTPGKYKGDVTGRVRHYAVSSGDRLTDSWELSGFQDGKYHLIVCGPNGFFREFKGSANDPALQAKLEYVGHDVLLKMANNTAQELTIITRDLSYGASPRALTIAANDEKPLHISLSDSHAWYDLEVTVEGLSLFSARFSGHVETGQMSFSDPLLSPINS